MRKRSSGRGSRENSFWQSYSDILASLLMVFILIMTGTILQMMIEHEQSEAALDAAVSVAESVADANREKAEELEKIVGIRKELVDELVREFSNSDMEGKLTVDAQTGAIVFDSNLLFDFNKAVLTGEGKSFLKSFMPKYIKVLLNDKFSPYVAEIIIEGHSDTVSGYIYNLELSMDRAYQVAAYALRPGNIFSEDQLEQVRGYMTVNGRSHSEPILGSDGKPDDEASRRVELQFRLKEDEMIDLMRDTLSGNE